MQRSADDVVVGCRSADQLVEEVIDFSTNFVCALIKKTMLTVVVPLRRRTVPFSVGLLLVVTPGLCAAPPFTLRNEGRRGKQLSSDWLPLVKRV